MQLEGLCAVLLVAQQLEVQVEVQVGSQAGVQALELE